MASGRNLDAAFGLIDTVEKAAVIYLTASSSGGIRQMLDEAQLRALAERFGVKPDPEMLSDFAYQGAGWYISELRSGRA